MPHVSIHPFFKDFSKILFLDLELFRHKKFWAIFEIFFTQTGLFTAAYPTYALIKMFFLQNKRTKNLACLGLKEELNLYWIGQGEKRKKRIFLTILSTCTF